METKMLVKKLPRECFGVVVTTRGIADEVPSAIISRLLDRHFDNDWGELDEEDAELNADAVNACEGRIMSSYAWPELKERIWIVSYLQSEKKLQQDMDYCYTTVMYPSEY